MLTTQPALFEPTVTITRDEAVRTVSEALERGCKHFVITYVDGKREKCRLTVLHHGVRKFYGRCRRYVYTWDIPYEKIVSIRPAEKTTHPVIEALTRGRSVWSKRHPRLWPEGQRWADLTDEEIMAIALSYPSLDSVREHLREQDFPLWGFPEFKTLYLSSCRATNVTEDEYQKLLQEIRSALDEGKELHRWWRGSYDFSVSIEPDRGVAHFSAEFKDKGNGHYYILINEKMALFVEDD